MNEAQNTKFVPVIHPAAIVDNASFPSASIDTNGYEYCQILVHVGATDVAMAALKLQQSDDDGVSDAYTDIAGLDFDGDADIEGNAASLPGDTADNQVFVLEIDLRARKRYVDLVATAGDGAAGTFLSAVAILSRGKQLPTTVSGRNAGGVLRV